MCRMISLHDSLIEFQSPYITFTNRVESDKIVKTPLIINTTQGTDTLFSLLEKGLPYLP